MGLPVMAASSCAETCSLAVSICATKGQGAGERVCKPQKPRRRTRRDSGPVASLTGIDETATHLVLLGERLVGGRLEEEDAPGDVDDGRAGHLAQRLSERERLGRKDVAVAVVRACESGSLVSLRRRDTG